MIKKLSSILRMKSIPFLASLILITLSLVTCIVLAPPQQFILGANSASWTIYPSDMDQVRYLPGTGTPAGSQQPSAPTDANPDTFAFKLTTDAFRVCAVKIELTSAVDNTEFSKFQISVQWWDEASSAWKDEKLYAGEGSSTIKSYIDGLKNPVDVGYVHHAASKTKYYSIKVTYRIDTSISINVTFQYTIQLQPSSYFMLGIVIPALIISVWLLYPKSKQMKCRDCRSIEYSVSEDKNWCHKREDYVDPESNICEKFQTKNKEPT